MRLITSMRLFGCSHTHFGMGSAYLEGYRCSVPDRDDAIFIFESAIRGTEPQDRGSAGIVSRARKVTVDELCVYRRAIRSDAGFI